MNHKMTTQTKSRIMGGLLLCLALLLYLFTLDNGLRPDELVGGDLITHQYAQAEARWSNAPGYPLYVMGGWLWFHLAGGLLSEWLNSTAIISFYSTLWGLASLGLLYGILLQISLGRWPLPFLLTAFYGTTYFFWYYSVTTEQYSSAVFQTLLLVWLAFKWEEDPRDGLLLWLAFVCGTMLANMLTTLFILPPLLWFIFSRPTDNHGVQGGTLCEAKHFAFDSMLKPLRRLFSYSPKLVGQGLAVTFLPLLSYAYIYIRGAQHPEWRGAGQWPTTWTWFWQFVTIKQGQDELAPGLTLHNFFTCEFPALIWQELTWPIVVGGLLGLLCLGRRRAMLIYGTLIIYAIFCWSYRFGNWFQVIIPTYPLIIIGFAAGAEWLIDRKTGILPVTPRQARCLSYLSIIFLLAYRLTASLCLARPHIQPFHCATQIAHCANQRNQPADTGLSAAWAILADSPTTPAIIYSDFEERVGLEYLQTIWGIGAGITLQSSDFRSFKNFGSLNQKSYITRQALARQPEIIQLGTVYPQAAGEQLIALAATPLHQLPPTARPLNLDFGGKLRLVGWEKDQDLTSFKNLSGLNKKWQIALYWQTDHRLVTDYTMSVRPLVNGQMLMANGQPHMQDHQPVWGVYPTSRWQSGEIVRDVYAIALPNQLEPNGLQIVVYHSGAGGFENLAEQTIRN